MLTESSFLLCKPIPSPLPTENLEDDYMKDKRLASMEDSLDQIFDSIPGVLEAQQKHRFLRSCVCYKQRDNSTE